MIISSRPRTSHRGKSWAFRQGFTLIEMLVVITIIGILAGLTVVVAARAMKTAREAAVVMEISQLDQALAQYKSKYGEYPPDGTDFQTNIDPSTNIPLSFLRHFNRVFPKASLTSELNILNKTYKFPCDPTNKTQMTSFFANYTPSTALVFWLGGMQEDNYSTNPTKNPKSLFKGFSANPLQPLSDSGSTRIPPMYEFSSDKINDPGQIAASTTIFRTYLANANVAEPFVYFRAEVSQHPREYLAAANTVKMYKNIAKPYYDSASQSWINPTSYQILFCGFDNTFGTGNFYPLGRWVTDPNPTGATYFFKYDNANYDDITNFAGGRIDSKIPQ